MYLPNEYRGTSLHGRGELITEVLDIRPQRDEAKSERELVEKKFHSKKHG